MKITLRQLAVFDAIARLNSVSEAARELHLSQSAASLALQDLERALGVQLFHRHRKRLALNGNGQRLQPQASSMLAMAQEIEGAKLGSPAGVLRVAATATIGNYVMPQLCAHFLESNADVQLKFTVTEESEIIEKVQDLALDLGFVEGASMPQTLMVEPWLRDELLVIASPQHWAAGKVVSMQQLRNEAWYLQPIGSPTRHQFTQPYSALLWSGPIRFESNSVEAIKGAVAAGKGLGCLSRFAVADDLACGRLASLKVSNFRLSRRFNILSRKDIFHGEAHAAFLEEARQLGKVTTELSS